MHVRALIVRSTRYAVVWSCSARRQQFALEIDYSTHNCLLLPVCDFSFHTVPKVNTTTGRQFKGKQWGATNNVLSTHAHFRKSICANKCDIMVITESKSHTIFGQCSEHEFRNNSLHLAIN